MLGGKRDTGIVSCSCPGISSSFSLPPSGVSRLYDVTRFKTSFPSRASRLPYLLLAATPAPFTSTSSPRRSWRELCSAPLACRTATKERAGGMAAPVRLRCACFPWGGRCDVRHRVQRRLSRHYQSPIRNSPRASRAPTCLFGSSSRKFYSPTPGHTANAVPSDILRGPHLMQHKPLTASPPPPPDLFPFLLRGSPFFLRSCNGHAPKPTPTPCRPRSSKLSVFVKLPCKLVSSPRQLRPHSPIDYFNPNATE